MKRDQYLTNCHDNTLNSSAFFKKKSPWLSHHEQNMKSCKGSNKLIVFLINLSNALGKFMPVAISISLEYMLPTCS